MCAVTGSLLFSCDSSRYRQSVLEDQSQGGDKGRQPVVIAW